MNKVFALENEKSWKSVHVTSERLYLINKSYDSVDDFIKGYSDTGIGSKLLKSRKEIDLFDISAIEHAEKDPTDLVVFYQAGKITLTFKNPADLAEVAEYLAAERNLAPSSQQVGTMKAIQSPLIGLGFTILLGWILYGEAQTLEAGGTIDTSGRRAWLKSLMATAAEKLGTTGVLVLAVVVGAAFAYFIYRNLQQPPSKIRYA
ncbi:MAG TPA: hypothetical protein VFZ78_00210 [Flavisolibacter sp.]